MRYTKYAYNQKKKSNFLFSLIIVIILGSVTGGLLFKLLFKNVNGLINSKDNTQNVSTGSVKDEDYEKKFIAVQCGVFKNQDNAKTLADSLTGYTPLVIEESGQYKVIAGIFNNKKDVSKINKLLIANGVEGYSIKFDLSKEDNSLKYEIIKAYIKILNKVTEENVKSINTEEFKKWVSENSKGNSNKEITELVKNIESLPQDINKQDNNERLEYLYKFLLKYKI